MFFIICKLIKIGVVHLAPSRFSTVLGEFHGRASAYARGNMTVGGAHTCINACFDWTNVGAKNETPLEIPQTTPTTRNFHMRGVQVLFPRRTQNVPTSTCLKDAQGTCCFCFKGLIHIAQVVYDLKEELLEDLDLLNNDFMSNG